MKVNTPGQVLFASLIGTTIEFFDFYIYATAAVLVFPRLFFPSTDPAAATLASLATFAIAFVARPIGSVLFGHFGDRIGRKTTLVAALLTMGISTVLIGVLPTYETIGFAAPLLLALCRFGQGIGLGGEWGGAVLLATENAPPGKRAWYGMFPQLGAPIGFLFSGSTFLLLSRFLTDEQFFNFGWRIPFLASAVLVALGLYVRLTITETPIFAEAVNRQARVKIPVVEVFRSHSLALVLGILISIVAYALFYLMSVFTLSWGTTALGYTRTQFLMMQLFGILFFAATIPFAGKVAEHGRRKAMIWMTALAIVFGLVMPALFAVGNNWRDDDARPRVRPHRPGLWPARHGAVGDVSDIRALHGQLDRVQRGGDLRRHALVVRGDVAGAELRPELRRVLPVGRRDAVAARAAREQGNQRRRHARMTKQPRRSRRTRSLTFRSSLRGLRGLFTRPEGPQPDRRASPGAPARGTPRSTRRSAVR